MVSTRCIIMVKTVLEEAGLQYDKVELGEAVITECVSEKQYIDIKTALDSLGLELILDRKSVLVVKIKKLVVEIVHHSGDIPLATNFSYYLSKKLQYDYTYLANIFSALEGITIEQFMIARKIERAKILIANNELNFSEIAWKLHYSSLSHLSSQFKKVTGVTPSLFKQQIHKRLTALNNV